MSIRSADPAVLEEAARALRTSAARTGLHAHHLSLLRQDAATAWWGGHAVVWGARAAQLDEHLRRAEDRVRRVADAADRYASAVRDAQRRLAALDAERDDVLVAQARALHGWSREPAAARGARPGAAARLEELAGRQRAVEEQARLEARRFAGAVDSAVEDVPRPLTPLDGLRWVTGSPLYERVAQLETVRDLVGVSRRGADAAAALAAGAPRVLRGAGRVLGPLGVLSDLDTLLHGDGDDSTSSGRETLDRVLAGVGLGVQAVAVGAAVAGVTVVAGVSVAPVVAGATTATVVVGGALLLWDWTRPPAPPARRAAAQVAARAPRPAVPAPRAGVLAAPAVAAPPLPVAPLPRQPVPTLPAAATAPRPAPGRPPAPARAAAPARTAATSRLRPLPPDLADLPDLPVPTAGRAR